jgi:hypothetical protein
VGASLEGSLLVLQPIEGASNVASRIIVRASANGKTTEKSFVAMVCDQQVGLGKSFEVTGLFESQNDFNMHKVILDGACTITGYNGYSNQAFFSSVLEENGDVISSPTYEPITRTFARDVYFLGASLRQNPWGAGMFFIYEPGVNDQYMLSVSCPQADEQTTTLAALLGIDLSGTALPGDLDGNQEVDLADAILGLQVMSGKKPTGLRADFASSGADVGGDGKIGMEDVIYILQKTSGLR